MKYGDIISIDMIHPRGCAFIVMNRRQDAHKAMTALKNYKLQGRAITISWAAGKGVKSKEWKDYWDLELGCSYVPWNKLDNATNLDELEEGGMFDEDSMPGWLKEKIKSANQKKEQATLLTPNPMFGDLGTALDTTQPPPTGPPLMQNVPLVPQFPMGPMPRLMPPMGMHITPNIVPGMPLGVPPPPQMNTQMMLQAGPMVPGVPPPSAGPGNAAFMSHFPPMPGQMPPQMAPHMPPQIPPPPILSSSSNNNNNNDDHMDIDMDDEPSSAKLPNSQPMNSLANVGPFNRPPPQMFNQSSTMPITAPPAPIIGSTINVLSQPFPPGNNKDTNSQDGRGGDRRRERSDSRDRRNNSRDRDRERDFRSSDRGRERERDVRNKDRDRNDRDRDRRTDYNNRDRDRNTNSRWGNDRGRSRDNEMPHRDRRNNSRDRDRNPPRERNERDKSLQDRLRDMAGENSRMEFSRRNDGNSNEWRDGSGNGGGSGGMLQNTPAHAGGNFPGNFMDQNSRNIRPLNMGPMNMGPSGQMGVPPPLTDLRLGMMDGGMRGQQPPQPINHRGEFGKCIAWLLTKITCAYQLCLCVF